MPKAPPRRSKRYIPPKPLLDIVDGFRKTEKTSKGERVTVRDVKGEGSCFPLALFHALKEHHHLPRVLAEFKVDVRVLQSEQAAESAFVTGLRKYVVDNYNFKELFEHLTSIKDNYPDTYNSLMDLDRVKAHLSAGENPDSFKELYARQIMNNETWFEGVEVEFIQQQLNENFELLLTIVKSDASLKDLNTAPPVGWMSTRLNEIILVNHNDNHYMYVLQTPEFRKTVQLRYQSQGQSTSPWLS